MTRAALVVALALALAAAARIGLPGGPASAGGEGALALGLLLVVGFVTGRFTRKIGLPGITGYMLAGLALGPWLVSRWSGGVFLVSPSSIDELRFIDSMALGLIAFTAGGEMRISTLRSDAASVAIVTSVQVLATGAAMFCVFALAGPHIGFGSVEEGMGATIAAALVIAVASTAKSPATTIAVINESGAEGPMTRLTLGVTVLKDVVVIALFAAALATAKTLTTEGGGFDASFALWVGFEVIGSILAGIVLGGLLGLYIGHSARELPLIVLATAFAAVFVAGELHLSGLLICLVSGFVVENFSPHGETLVKAVEKYSLPVYVVFFAIAGATLDLSSLAGMGAAAALFVGVRLAVTIVSTWAGLRLSGKTESWSVYAGLGFIGQAGVTLGFAALVANIPVVGQKVQTLLIAAVAVNQVIGPVLFKFALDRAGETGRDCATEEAGECADGVCEDL